MANRWGNSDRLYFLGSKITADGDCSHEIKRRLLLERKVMTNLDSLLKSRDITLPTKGPSSQTYGFSSSLEWMWELDYKESWAPKNWSLSLNIAPSNELPGLISFRMDWLDLLAVKGTLKSLLQHKHQFFGAQLSSQSNSHVHTDYWKNRSLV